MVPSGPAAVQPETHTVSPTRTAREYPTTGSHRPPDDTRARGRIGRPGLLAAGGREVRHHLLGEEPHRAGDLLVRQVPGELGHVLHVGNVEVIDRLAEALDCVHAPTGG